MGKNKSRNYTKQKLSNFVRTGKLNRDMIEDLGDDCNEEKYENNHRRRF